MKPKTQKFAHLKPGDAVYVRWFDRADGPFKVAKVSAQRITLETGTWWRLSDGTSWGNFQEDAVLVEPYEGKRLQAEAHKREDERRRVVELRRSLYELGERRYLGSEAQRGDTITTEAQLAERVRVLIKADEESAARLRGWLLGHGFAS